VLMLGSSSDILRQWIDAVNSGDRRLCRASWRHDILWTNRASGQQLSGRDQVTDYLWSWRDGFPDLNVEITDSFRQVSRGLVETNWTGMLTRPLRSRRGTIAPTGQRLSWTSAYVIGLLDDRIATISEYFDPLSLLPYASSFPTISSVVTERYSRFPGISKGPQSWDSLFPDIAAVEVSSTYPQLARISWDRRIDVPVDAARPRQEVASSFPEQAAHGQ
jgi:ketosteroid isomerase-like protein